MFANWKIRLNARWPWKAQASSTSSCLRSALKRGPRRQPGGIVVAAAVLVRPHQAVQRVCEGRIGGDCGFVMGDGLWMFARGKKIERGVKMIFRSLAQIAHR